MRQAECVMLGTTPQTPEVYFWFALGVASCVTRRSMKKSSTAWCHSRRKTILRSESLLSVAPYPHMVTLWYYAFSVKSIRLMSVTSAVISPS